MVRIKRLHNQQLTVLLPVVGKKKGHYQKVMYLTGERDDSLPCHRQLTKEYEGRERHHSEVIQRVVTYSVAI